MLFVKNMVFLDGAIATPGPRPRPARRDRQHLDVLRHAPRRAPRRASSASTRRRSRSTSTASRPASASTPAPSASPTATCRRAAAVIQQRMRDRERPPQLRPGAWRGAGRRRYRASAVRLVIARCSVDYAGRLTAHLPEAVRLIMVKADGCVADPRRRRRLQAAELDERAQHARRGATGAWIVTNPKGETLTITLHEVLSRHRPTSSASTRACRRTASRPTCRSCWRRRRDAIEAGLTLVRREYPTDIGPVDLLCRDADGPRSWRSRSSAAARSTGSSSWPATSSGCDLDPSLGAGARRVRRPGDQAPGAGAGRGPRASRCVEVDYDELRGIEPDELRLF